MVCLHIVDATSKRIDINNREETMLNIATVLYKRPEFIDLMLYSIEKHCKGPWHLYIYANHDMYYTPRRFADRVTVFDNTKGQLMPMHSKEDLMKHATYGLISHKQHKNYPIYCSMCHILSIQQLIDNIPDGFVLLDSDVIVLKDLQELVKSDQVFVGSGFKDVGGLIRHQVFGNREALPFCCYINVPMMNKHKLSYFHPKYFWFSAALPNGGCTMFLKDGRMISSDTGGWLFKQCYDNDLPFMKVDISQYVHHFKGGSVANSRIRALSTPYMQESYDLPIKRCCVCAIGKMQNAIAREFVEYYKKQGWDNVIIIDNNDIAGERFEDVLQDEIDLGFVEIISEFRGRLYHKEFTNLQVDIHRHCMDRLGERYTWMAFFDFDEFLDIGGANIRDFLEDPRRSKSLSISIHWDIKQGVGGEELCEDESIVKRCTKSMPVTLRHEFNSVSQAAQVKTIVAARYIVTNHIPYQWTSAHKISIKQWEQHIHSGITANIEEGYLCAKLNHYEVINIRDLADRRILCGCNIKQGNAHRMYMTSSRAQEGGWGSRDEMIQDLRKRMFGDKDIQTITQGAENNISEQERMLSSCLGFAYSMYKSWCDGIYNKADYISIGIDNTSEILCPGFTNWCLINSRLSFDGTIRNQFVTHHGSLAMEIIEKCFRSSTEATSEWMNVWNTGNVFYARMQFIMESGNFKRMCDDIFALLLEFIKYTLHAMGISTPGLTNIHDALKLWCDVTESGDVSLMTLEYGKDMLPYVLERFAHIWVYLNLTQHPVVRIP
jgi:hypothetical protein